MELYHIFLIRLHGVVRCLVPRDNFTSTVVRCYVFECYWETFVDGEIVITLLCSLQIYARHCGTRGDFWLESLLHNRLAFSRGFFGNFKPLSDIIDLRQPAAVCERDELLWSEGQSW